MRFEDSLTLTFIWFTWCILWAARSLIVRKGHKYAQGKQLKNQNRRYKYLSTLAFCIQVVVGGLSFWSNAPILLILHFSDVVRVVGFSLCFAGLALSIFQLVHLGDNYSPCYDSHLPKRIVYSGPYKLIRHPGWTSKILVGIGTILATQSAWFLLLMVWLLIELRRTIRVEEEYLVVAFPEYELYRRKTKAFIPFIY